MIGAIRKPVGDFPSLSVDTGTDYHIYAVLHLPYGLLSQQYQTDACINQSTHIHPTTTNSLVSTGRSGFRFVASLRGHKIPVMFCFEHHCIGGIFYNWEETRIIEDNGAEWTLTIPEHGNLHPEQTGLGQTNSQATITSTVDLLLQCPVQNCVRTRMGPLRSQVPCPTRIHKLSLVRGTRGCFCPS